jgi:alpha-glucosidase
LFGSLGEFDELLAAAHGRGLKVLLDLVPNHTSDQHPWFIESRSSRYNPKRSWYIWRDPGPDGGPPNNWLSEFGGGAWEFDEATSQYYYHAFLREQPDLNWRNPDVRTAIYDVMRFLLRRGVDGFRVDVIWHLMKDPQFRDNPINPAYREGQQPILDGREASQRCSMGCHHRRVVAPGRKSGSHRTPRWRKADSNCRSHPDKGSQNRDGV